MSNKRSKERGATALIVVMFATILFAITTISFVQMMVRERTRSTDNALSQAAYDAALAGVEDAKRVLATCNSGGSAAQSACAAIKNSTDSKLSSAEQCMSIAKALYQEAGVQDEVLLQSQATLPGYDDGKSFDQAYTCVKVVEQTNSVVGSAQTDGSAILSLKSATPFSGVRISWYSKEDVVGASSTLDVPAVSVNRPFLTFSDWTENGSRPSVMRAQLMQFSAKAGFNSASFDDKESSGKLNSATMYLYPMFTSVAPDSSFSIDGANRRSGSLSPVVARCVKTFALSRYACSATLSVPQPIGGTSGKDDRVAYLRLTSLYAGTHFKIELLDESSQVVLFDGIQPVVDSTGRASDIFRRVGASVQLGPSQSELYPRATVDVTGSFCKTSDASCSP